MSERKKEQAAWCAADGGRALLTMSDVFGCEGKKKKKSKVGVLNSETLSKHLCLWKGVATNVQTTHKKHVMVVTWSKNTNPTEVCSLTDVWCWPARFLRSHDSIYRSKNLNGHSMQGWQTTSFWTKGQATSQNNTVICTCNWDTMCSPMH